MPGRNIVKQYEEGGYYHLYNRGVEKREIFLDELDYRVFFNLLKRYLVEDKQNPMNLADEVDLVGYCLMPNHFHLLVRQHSRDGITKLMRRVITNYVMYFNQRYDREGTLFQGIYRAVRIKSGEQLMQVARYIDLNPKDYKEYPYSSLWSITNQRIPAWLKPMPILEYFGTSERYQEFVAEGSTLQRVEPS